MSRFFVGQRVRILWSNNWPELNGTTGRIVAEASDFDDHDDQRSEWEVSADVWGGSICPYDAEYFFCPNGEQLEPATDANTVISFDECIWKPEHMRAET